jgi:hypothetical protein
MPPGVASAILAQVSWDFYCMLADGNNRFSRDAQQPSRLVAAQLRLCKFHGHLIMTLSNCLIT